MTAVIDWMLNTYIYLWMYLIKHRRLCCLVSFTCQAPRITGFDHTVLMLGLMTLPLWCWAEKQKKMEKTNSNLWFAFDFIYLHLCVLSLSTNAYFTTKTVMCNITMQHTVSLASVPLPRGSDALLCTSLPFQRNASALECQRSFANTGPSGESSSHRQSNWIVNIWKYGEGALKTMFILYFCPEIAHLIKKTVFN